MLPILLSLLASSSIHWRLMHCFWLRVCLIPWFCRATELDLWGYWCKRNHSSSYYCLNGVLRVVCCPQKVAIPETWHKHFYWLSCIVTVRLNATSHSLICNCLQFWSYFWCCLTHIYFYKDKCYQSCAAVLYKDKTSVTRGVWLCCTKTRQVLPEVCGCVVQKQDKCYQRCAAVLYKDKTSVTRGVRLCCTKTSVTRGVRLCCTNTRQVLPEVCDCVVQRQDKSYQRCGAVLYKDKTRVTRGLWLCCTKTSVTRGVRLCCTKTRQVLPEVCGYVVQRQDKCYQRCAAVLYKDKTSVTRGVRLCCTKTRQVLPEVCCCVVQRQDKCYQRCAAVLYKDNTSVTRGVLLCCTKTRQVLPEVCCCVVQTPDKCYQSCAAVLYKDKTSVTRGVLLCCTKTRHVLPEVCCCVVHLLLTFIQADLNVHKLSRGNNTKRLM